MEIAIRTNKILGVQYFIHNGKRISIIGDEHLSRQNPNDLSRAFQGPFILIVGNKRIKRKFNNLKDAISVGIQIIENKEVELV